MHVLYVLFVHYICMSYNIEEISKINKITQNRKPGIFDDLWVFLTWPAFSRVFDSLGNLI